MDSLTVGALAAAVVLLICLIDVMRADPVDVRMLGRTVWLVIVVLLPVAGPLAWFLLGRPHHTRGRRAARGSRPTAKIKTRKITNNRKAAVERLTSDIRPTSQAARALAGPSGGSPGATRFPIAVSQESPLLLGESYAPMPPEAYRRPHVPSPVREDPVAREPELVGRRAAPIAGSGDPQVAQSSRSARRGLIDEDGEDW